MPLHGWDTRKQLLRVHTSDCRVFKTAKKAPYLLLLEFADLDEAATLVHSGG